MGKTFSTGLLTDGIAQDSSNNIGIGGAVNASYKLTVTGTSLFTDNLSVTSTYGFTIGAVSGVARIQHGSSAANSFTFLTSGNGFANLYAGAATFSSSVTAGARIQAQGSNGAGSTQGGFLINYNANASSRSWLINNDQEVFGDFAIMTSTTQTGSTYTSRLYINPSGNVGIGTSSPFAKFSVGSPSGIGSFPAYSTTDQASIGWNYWTSAAEGYTRYMDIVAMGAPDGTYGGSVIRFLTNGITNGSTPAERMRIASNGKVLINRTTSSTNAAGERQLEMNGNIFSLGGAAGYFFEDRSNATYWYGWYATGNTTVYFFNGQSGTNIASIAPSNGTYTALSDVNKKKDFEASTIGLKEILSLKPTLYRMKTDDETSDKHLGFIAQEVKDFIPQAYVENGDDDNKFIGLQDRPIIAALVKAMQEQQEIINQLSAKVTALENR